MVGGSVCTVYGRVILPIFSIRSPNCTKERRTHLGGPDRYWWVDRAASRCIHRGDHTDRLVRCRELRQQSNSVSIPCGHSWLVAIAQIGALEGFAWLTVGVQKGMLQPSSISAFWCLAWVTAGLAMLGLWFVAAIPFRLWCPLASRGGIAVLLAGCLVGTVSAEVAGMGSALWERDQGQALNSVTTRLVYYLLHLVCPNPVYQPEEWIVGTSDFSAGRRPRPLLRRRGYGSYSRLSRRSLGIFRRSFNFPRPLLLLPLGVALVWLANVLPIASLVTIGTWGYPDIADKGFHTHAGWIAFNVVGLGLVLSTRRTSVLCSG